MALQIFIAHSGQRLQTDPGSFASLDDFKAWVAKNTVVAAQNHISLTAQGKTVRTQDLQAEKQIYIYDRRIVQSSSSASPKSLVSEISLPGKYNVAKPPDTISDQTDLQAWKDLFMARRSWAFKVLEDCGAMSDSTQQRYDEMRVITECLDAALANLEKHLTGLDRRYREVQEWGRDLQRDQGLYGTDWEASLTQLRALPVTAQFLKFITGRSFRKSRNPCLEDLVDTEDVRKAGVLTHNLVSQLSRNLSDLGAKIDKVFKTADDVQNKVDEAAARSVLNKASDSVQLMQDIEPIAKKVSNDYENVLSYSNTSKNVSQASKSALLHTRKLLPDLSRRSLEMDGLLRSATEARNFVAAESLEIMHGIASLTAMLSDLNSRFATFELDSNSFESFQLLSFVHKLPVTYASFVAEAIRRREWSDKVKADSSTLANEMAVFQDEEAKRRRKWQKSTGTILWGDKTEHNTMSLEVNLHGEEEEWPPASRQELDELLAILQTQNAKAEVIKDVTKIVSDLNNPTKQQSKRTRAFKAGSIHEAALGRSALLVRGDDDLIRVLQEEKLKTEGKLKTAESRVRRLEDLLHRQSHISRTSTGNVFQANSPIPEAQNNTANPIASPRLNDDLSRRSSVSSRRFSANHGADEKALQQKLLGMEAELIAERERASGMEKEISAKQTAASEMKTQFEEANSTKKDLMENFEAQQREFLEERKSLEAEIKRLKGKLEELEDEMDRFLGSRENVDDRVRSLQDELDKLRKESAEEAQKAQGQVDFLRNDAKMQRETNDNLERRLKSLREENRLLVARAERAESAEDEQSKTLRRLHAQLSASSPIPDDVSTLSDALTSMVGEVLAELESHKHELGLVKADKVDAENTMAKIRSEITEVREKLTTEEEESAQLRQTLDAERAKFAALETEIADERLQLSTLRTKIADGETGSEAIRSRLEEEERKVTSMSEDLATKMSRIGSLEEELKTFQEKSDSAQAKFNKLTAHFESRTLRAKDLTQRIYAQNDRLCMLLEQLSYAVTRGDKSMTIQRLPRPERLNQNNDSSDPGSNLRRSISGAVTRRAMAESADLDLLYWMHSEDSEEESEKYEAYLKVIDSFDVEMFSATITKRVKDLEYTLKKYSKDIRAYREKSHSAQKEAHSKIAFKNFKEGDLALFLPTRNQATGAWAAFNVGAPHYFLHEQDSHKLRSRDWLLARIHKIEDRVVDLSKSISSTRPNISDGRSFGEASNGGDSFDDDNPFELSDGLRWYLLEAHEEKSGAPSTPGLGKSTVASTHVDASGDIRRSKKSSSSGVEGINKTLSKSLDSRRSSNNSKQGLATNKAVQPASGSASLNSIPAGQPVEGSSSDARVVNNGGRQDTNGDGERAINSEVRGHNIDELMGP